MQNETKFGKSLNQYVLTSQKALQKRLLFLAAAIMLAVVGIIMMTMERETDRVFLFGIIAEMCAACFVWKMLFNVKASETVIYENGLIHTLGSKVTEMNFNDLAGMRDLKKTEMWLSGLIPVLYSKKRTVTVERKDGTSLKLTKINVHNFNQFADDFGSVFAEKLLSGVTKENLGQTNISFGKELELSGGQLLYDEGNERKTIIPLNAIIDIEDNDGIHILLIGEKKKEKNLLSKRSDVLAIISIESALNLGVLYRVIQIAQGN